MPKLNFNPTHYLGITYSCSIGIHIVHENGETVVQNAFFDEQGKQKSKVAKATVRFDSKGHPYFLKNRQRYYLNDFIKKSPF